MNRTDRLSAILILLQTKKIVRSKDIAERFSISQRTVYRDLRALDEAGVPIGAEAGVGYYLTDGYHLPPVMFTPEEAGSLLIAEKLVDSFSDESVRSNFGLASDKIKSVLPASHQEFLGEVDRHIHVFHSSQSDGNNFRNNYITSIQQAISKKKCISVNYFSHSKKEESRRIVEPIGLCFYGFNWHLIAFCQLRNDYRDFRLDRIKKLEITSSCTTESANKTISEYFEIPWKQEEVFTVVIKFKASAKSQIANSKYYFGFFEEQISTDSILMKFAVNDYNYIAGWVLSLGEIVEDVSPQILKDTLKKTVGRLAKQYL